ncbi:sugar transporter, partial [Methylobacterium sp. J-068]|nr:sugar transporter [Methylobacterium sp. J-068]
MVRHATLAALAACLVSGCSSLLPAAGPTTGAVIDGADVSTSEGTFARYEIVDLSAATVEALRGRALDSLLASFGDKRQALEPVIGVGDFVAVSVWEAGS